MAENSRSKVGAIPRLLYRFMLLNNGSNLRVELLLLFPQF